MIHDANFAARFARISSIYTMFYTSSFKICVLPTLMKWLLLVSLKSYEWYPSIRSVYRFGIYHPYFRPPHNIHSLLPIITSVRQHWEYNLGKISQKKQPGKIGKKTEPLGLPRIQLHVVWSKYCPIAQSLGVQSSDVPGGFWMPSSWVWSAGSLSGGSGFGSTAGPGVWSITGSVR